MDKFEAGQKFSRISTESMIYGVGEERRYHNDGVIREVESITCIMENGEMAYIPWFVVAFVEGKEIKVNGKFVIEVISK